MTMLTTAFKPITSCGQSGFGQLDIKDPISSVITLGDPSPARFAYRQWSQVTGFAGGEAGIQENSGAGNLLLRDVGCVARADLLKNKAFSVATKSVLKQDQSEQDDTGAERDQRC